MTAAQKEADPPHQFGLRATRRSLRRHQARAPGLGPDLPPPRPSARPPAPRLDCPGSRQFHRSWMIRFMRSCEARLLRPVHCLGLAQGEVHLVLGDRLELAEVMESAKRAEKPHRAAALQVDNQSFLRLYPRPAFVSEPDGRLQETLAHGT